MNRLQKKFNQEIAPRMMKEFGYKNIMQVPKVEKIVLNIGTSMALKEPKYLDVMKENLTAIAGQAVVMTKAKKSISGFNIREGMVVGVKVILRRKKMFDFLDKLINVTLPRVRDFRGIKTSTIDRAGNLTIGFKECTVFPEIDPNKLELTHGLEVCLQTSAKSKEEGLNLFKLLGFPFALEKD